MMNNVKYIYNPTQAKFYIQNGVLPLDVDIHYGTMRKFWVFDTASSEEIYSKWCAKCEEFKRNKMRG